MESVIASAAPIARTVSDSAPVVGRYAPSPSGDLHLGNLRTALLAWLLARRAGGGFVLRVEDLDRVRAGAAEQQIKDLQAVGLDWDGNILYQSNRFPAYRAAVEKLADRGLIYECYCTRREIQAVTSAPHAAPGAYPGTCRNLTEDQRKQARRRRPAAIRLKSASKAYTVIDEFAGAYTGDVDDFVLVRGDGTYAYNLAVVVDDHFQQVTQVTRGNDLLSSAPRQAYLANLLGFEAPRYAHVPLALNTSGQRLAKRDGAVTLRQLLSHGMELDQVMTMISASIPLPPVAGSTGAHLPVTAGQMLKVFTPETMARNPWVVIDPVMKGGC